MHSSNVSVLWSFTETIRFPKFDEVFGWDPSTFYTVRVVFRLSYNISLGNTSWMWEANSVTLPLTKFQNSRHATASHLRPTVVRGLFLAISFSLALSDLREWCNYPAVRRYSSFNLNFPYKSGSDDPIPVLVWYRVVCGKPTFPIHRNMRAWFHDPSFTRWTYPDLCAQPILTLVVLGSD